MDEFGMLRCESSGRRTKKELSIINVREEHNVADGLTKHVDGFKMDQYIKFCGFIFREGRQELCPHLGDV